MNCYLDKFNNKFYCLNPINKSILYIDRYDFNNDIYFLESILDSLNLIHRLDGPAIEWDDGNKDWYYHGKLIDCNSQEEFEKILKMRAFL